MFFDLLLTALGLIILISGAELFVAKATAISAKMGASPFFIGAVVIGFGTSLPELLVSGSAANDGQLGLALGNVVGSNIANIGLILAAGALLTPIIFSKRFLSHQIPSLILTGALGWGLCVDGTFSRIDGFLLLSASLLTIAVLSRGGEDGPLQNETPATESTDSWPKLLAPLFIGVIALIGGAQLVVEAAVSLAHQLGINEVIIGITVLGIGSSLPELAASISSARRGQGQLIIGNIIGSNLFNIGLVLPLAVLIQPDAAPKSIVYRDFPVMLAITCLFFALALLAKNTINKWAGAVLLTSYLLYLTYLGATL